MTGPLVAYEGQRDSADRGFMEDGRKLWRLSQSGLKQVDVCSERGRRTLLRLDEDGATDSTAKGRAVHGAIEDCLNDVIAGLGPWHVDDMIAVACHDFDAEMALESSRWVKTKNASTVHRHIDTMLRTWHAQVLPTLRPLATEVNFGPFVIYEDSERVVEVKGQIDYIDEQAVCDWKTSSRRWDVYEHQRWDVQPSMYLWALTQDPTLPQPSDVNAWKWFVLQDNGDLQIIDCTRGEADFGWLRERCRVLAINLEAGIAPWPLNDNHWLCSEAYCAHWKACKGAMTAQNNSLVSKAE